MPIDMRLSGHFRGEVVSFANFVRKSLALKLFLTISRSFLAFAFHSPVLRSFLTMDTICSDVSKVCTALSNPIIDIVGKYSDIPEADSICASVEECVEKLESLI